MTIKKGGGTQMYQDMLTTKWVEDERSVFIEAQQAPKEAILSDTQSSGGVGYGSSDPYTSGGKGHQLKKFFQRIHVKRDNINNVGNLICFPLLPLPGQEQNQIAVVGGLNIIPISGKSHVYHTERQLINYKADLEIPVPDISKFFYPYRETKLYVVGANRIQEFDLETRQWSLKSQGYNSI